MGDGEARLGRRAFALVPALARRRLLYLDSEPAGGMDEVAGPPVAGAKLPLRFQRHSDDLLRHFTAYVVAQDWRAEEALGKAVDN